MSALGLESGICEVCKPAQEEILYHFDFPSGRSFKICGWCAERVRQFLNTSANDEAINIFYGAGKVTFPEMKWLGRFIYENNIKTIIEYGSGLSTEILAFFSDEVVSFDEFEKHHAFYKRLNHLKPIVDFRLYSSFEIDPKDRKPLPPVGRKFDMAFVDGGQERSREVRHAMEHAERFIYLADPHMGEDGFFPGGEWECIWGEERMWKRKSVN